MLSGIFLGLMTFVSLVITFLKLPKWLQRIILKFKLLSDLGAGVLIFMALGAISQSIVAIVGAITGGLLVGLALEIIGLTNAKRNELQSEATSR